MMIDSSFCEITREKIDNLAEMLFPNLSNSELVAIARRFESTLK